MKTSKKVLFVFLFSFATLISTLGEHENSTSAAAEEEHDVVWKERAERAWLKTLEAYEPNPERIVNLLNHKVNKAIKESANDSMNDSRRILRGKHKKYDGPCMCTNPIDKCWRCRPDWAEDRKRLASCVVGFGHKTEGGKRGEIYVVTDPSDDNVVDPKPGTLRKAVIMKEPLWIIFARDMHIKLHCELIVQSKKTIDGRGANVHIAHGAGITLQFVEDIIIHGIHIHHICPSKGGMVRDSVDHKGLRTVGDGDGVNIFGSSNIWLDHLSMSECQDGLIDAIQGSTGITISNCHFTHHNDVILLGASDSYEKDQMMQVTVAFNHFGKELIQRMPRCRWGFFHVVNNDYTHWKMYAIGGSMHPTIISQGNRFIAPDDPNAKEITNRNYATEKEWCKWVWRSEGDLLMNGAKFRTSGPDVSPHWDFSSTQMIKAEPATFVNKLTQFAGALDCKKGEGC